MYQILFYYSRQLNELSGRFVGSEAGRGGGAENRGRGEESSRTEGGVRSARRNRSREGKINTIKPKPALHDTYVERRQIPFTVFPVPKFVFHVCF